MLSDLRESGSIEQDADIVVMLYREEYYSDKNSDAQITELIVAKHRNGPTGTAKLLFKPSITSFTNI
jgi:replicative DNA helicase